MDYQNQIVMNLQATHLSGLSIMPCLSHETELWSPFSAPSLSPFNNNSKVSFQYSASCVPEIQKLTCKKLPTPISKPQLKRKCDLTSHFQPSKLRNIVSHDIKKLPKRSEKIDLTDFIRDAMVQKSNGRQKVCTFCKSNGEAEHIYTSHALKNSINKITCPILMQYSCVECGATGENTHTIKYCPVMQRKSRMQLLNKFVARSNS